MTYIKQHLRIDALNDYIKFTLAGNPDIPMSDKIALAIKRAEILEIDLERAYTNSTVNEEKIIA